MKLYSYYRSSASYRVRIALALKNLPFDLEPVHLVKNGGEQKSPEFTALNPQQLVPALVTDDGAVLTQSLAILEYLEETYPDAPLLPSDKIARAKVREYSQLIACDIHPIDNLRVLQYLKKEFGISDEQKTSWYQHWIFLGFDALETMLPEGARFCYGETPTIADCCLIPQVYNAMRYNCEMSRYPNISRIYEHCCSLPAFQDASPEKQPDAP